MGSVIFLPLGFSYRAGCPGSLVAGCVECRHFGSEMACAVCGRRWSSPDRPQVADADTIWNSLHHHMPDCMCGACPSEDEADEGSGGDGPDWSGGAGGHSREEEWEDAEECEGEGYEGEWDEGEEQDGEGEWHGEEEYGEEQEEG